MISASRRAEIELDKFALDPSCKLYLPLRKLDGDSFMSKDAYGHLCTNVGNAHWTPQGWSFNGIDDYIDLDDALVADNLADFTLLSWVKTPKTDYQRIFSKQHVLIVHTHLGQLTLYLGNGTEWDTQSANMGAFTYGIWQHVAMVKQGTITNGYVNAEFKKQLAGCPATLGTNTNKTTVGVFYESGIEFWEDLIGELLFCSRALTPQEIQEHYLVGKELFG